MNAHERTRDLLVSAAALGGTAAAFGVWRVGHQGFWPDEAFSIRVAQLSLPTLFQVVTAGETFSAFYIGLLHFWQFWGTGEAWLRLLSVLFGVGAVLTLFALNERLFGLRTAITACVLLTVNVFFVRYMQEARAYTLALFLVVLASYCLVVALERPSARTWTIYGVVSALAIYAHLFAGFVLAAHLLSILMRQERPRLRLVGGAALLTAILVTPLAAVMLATDPLERSFIPTPRLDSFQWLFLHLTGGGGLPSRGANFLLLAYFVACCAGVIFMARAVLDRERRSNTTWSHVLTLLWLAVPVLSSFIISFANPIFYPRYLIVTLPALVTIAGIGISALPHRVLRALAVGALLALSTPPLLSYYRTPIREGGDWRAAGQYVARERQQDDGVVFLSRYGRGSIEYYLSRLEATEGLVPLYPAQPWGAYTPVLADLHLESTATAAEHIRGRTRVWSVLLWGGFDTTAEDANPIRAKLEQEFRQATVRQFGPSLEVRLYERR